ncbi:MAG: sulfatase-like hydrolase/transferase [Bacteroidales bacterium]|nr:sulfatase-like hydrolase/transferase [Bacteroidales bacterium]
MKRLFIFLLLFVYCLGSSAQMKKRQVEYDITKDRVLYTVGISHLDTEWRWGYTTTIDTYLKNTMLENFKHYGTHYWDIDGNKVKKNLDGDDSRVIMDRVLPFIDDNVAQENPFIAVVWFHTPHKPCVAGPKHKAMYPDQDLEMQNYAGCITAMDEQIGRLREHLEAIKADKNTMVWFCSDNGPETGVGVSGGFRDRKRSLYEGGVRVPGILVWPEKIKMSMETDFPAVTSDYLPTIADAVGISSDKLKYEIDGISLLPMLEGKMTERSKPIGLCIGNQLSLNADKYKMYAVGGEVEYYDIVNDPYETTPLLETKDLKKMTTEMNKMLDSYKGSFQGKEYGTESYQKMEQEWKTSGLK